MISLYTPKSALNAMVDFTIRLFIASVVLKLCLAGKIIGRTGQVIKKGVISSARMEVNISTLPAGSYWRRSNMNNQVQTLPFVKL